MSAQVPSLSVSSFTTEPEECEHTLHINPISQIMGHKARTFSDMAESRATETTPAANYSNPESFFSIGYTEGRSFYSAMRVYRGGIRVPRTWHNTSKNAASVEWVYEDPDNMGSTLTSTADELSITYGYNPDWWSAPELTAKSGDESNKYAPNLAYWLGAPSPMVFSDATLDLGITPYMQVGAWNAAGKRTATFMPLRFQPKANDMTSTASWAEILEPQGYTDLIYKGFFNIFHKPDSPYSITKLWGYTEFTTTKQTAMNITLYELADDGTITNNVIAKGTMELKANYSDKSMVFKLYRDMPDGSKDSSPIRITTGFIAVLDFDWEAFSKLLPINGSATIYPADEKCPYPYNCGSVLSYKKDGVTSEGYFKLEQPYPDKSDGSTVVGACDFIWMVNGNFAWIYETTGKDAVSFSPEGGQQDFTINSWYKLEDDEITISKDAEWIEYTVDEPLENAVDRKLTVSVPASDNERTGHITLAGPTTTLVLTVTQGKNAAIESVEMDQVESVRYYNLQGQPLDVKPASGIVIEQLRMTDGTVTARKIIL
ncbi:MAG: hypothetical protein NC131_15360 [Roseburia sp.]|nr:hypothetical protein [Roseburia sp.]